MEKLTKTCSKGFELKVTTLRLKTPLKMKADFIGNKCFHKKRVREMLSQAEPS